MSAIVHPKDRLARRLGADETVLYTQGGSHLTVRRAYCKACDLCVVACPEKILAIDEVDRVYVTDIDSCVFCGVCAGRCPDFVFLIERGPRTTGREEGSLWLAD